MTLAMLAQVACTSSTANDEQEVLDANDNHLSPDALGGNALGGNALGGNALGGNALGGNALGGNALGGNSLTSESLNNDANIVKALEDPLARELFKYIVSCALPAGEQVDVTVQGTNYEFDGALGVAPEWGEPGAQCGEDCRGWVSACVIARLDYLQQPETISLRGQNSGLKSTPQERASYSHIEATYYGDIFSDPKEIYACLPPGKTSIPRVCGPSLDTCVVKVQGSCEDLCGRQRKDGSYPNCREAAPPAKKCGGQKKGEMHVGSVTVFLQ
jgi:hypothetical protein